MIYFTIATPTQLLSTFCLDRDFALFLKQAFVSGGKYRSDEITVSYQDSDGQTVIE